jgi:hypothetical protein
MELTLTTPSLLFPAISLLMLAFTNRFLALASLIRNLYSDYKKNEDPKILKQIENLRKRLLLIRYMQATGILSLFCCVLCMFQLFLSFHSASKFSFVLSLVLMMASLSLSFWEVQISVNALKVYLSDMESKK